MDEMFLIMIPIAVFVYLLVVNMKTELTGNFFKDIRNIFN